MSVDSEQSKLSIFCIGMGAIGTYLGTSLIRGGARVAFIDHPETVELIKQTGISLHDNEGVYHVSRIEAFSSIKDALAFGQYDFGFIAVKSFDTPDLAESLNPFSKRLPPLISFQNGVENEQILREKLPDCRIIAGTVTSAISRLGTGEVLLERQRGVGIAIDENEFGCLQNVMNIGGLNAHKYPDADAMKWSKMLTNLQTNAVCAILNMLPVDVLKHPMLYTLEMTQLREALSVMKKMRISPVDLPGAPVRLLAWMVGKLPAWLSQPLAIQFLGRGRGEKKPSFLLDLEAGRSTSEVEFINGAVVRFGKKLSIATPINQILTDLLVGIVQDRIPWSDYSSKPQRLLYDIQESKNKGEET